MGVVAYLQQHWEHLAKTTTPFQDDHRSAVWILPESTDPRETFPRAVSVHALWKQTAVKLGVPRDEVHHHVSAECIDLWSRWGLPRNFPTLRGDLGDGPDSSEFARPLRELHRAYQHMAHATPADPQSTRSLPDTEEDEQPQRQRMSNRPPPGTIAPGRIQQRGTTGATSRWSTRSTAPASFRNQEAWVHFTYVPPKEKLRMRLDVIVYQEEHTEQPTNLESFVSTTLVGDGRLHSLILKSWAGQTTLRQNTHFSRAWTEEGTPDNMKWKGRPTDARAYLANLQRWCAANRPGTPMGFPFPWEPNRCGCFATLIKANSVANLPDEYITPEVLEQPPSQAGSDDMGPRAPDPPLLTYPSTATRTSPGTLALSRPWGTHLGVSIYYNVPISTTKWKPEKNLVELLHHEMHKLRKAPPGISDGLLHPDYRLEKSDGTELPITPGNPRNTLRILPTLGPVAPPCPGRVCNRCEQGEECPLRPVTNLYLGAWEGLPEDNEVAYLCEACVFPASPDNLSWQHLEYRDW